MAPASSQGAAGVFDASLGRLLIRVAYRMLGPVADTEDVVQDDVDRGALRGARTRN